MRFKGQRRGSQMLEVNLIPMLDVLMTVLTFFIVISMTLTLERGVEVELPNAEDSSQPPEAAPAPLIVQLNPQEQLLINNKLSTKAQLEPQMKTYLANNPQGFVVLQAAPGLKYEKVVQLLGDMKKIGGDRVSLAIE